MILARPRARANQRKIIDIVKPCFFPCRGFFATAICMGHGHGHTSYMAMGSTHATAGRCIGLRNLMFFISRYKSPVQVVRYSTYSTYCSD